MSGTTLDVENLIQPDATASFIARRWQELNSLRQEHLSELKEIRSYIYATDTRTTTNSLNPWRNTTAIPKLTQIYDNLKANYAAALFPNSKWLRWEGAESGSESREKRRLIQSYMYTKIRQTDMLQSVDRLLSDYIGTGNCYAVVDYVNDVYEDDNGLEVVKYQGPKLFRISPYDIVIDPTAADFKSSPKIIRSQLYLGEVEKLIKQGQKKYAKVFNKMLANRQQVGMSQDTNKGEGFTADGFSDISAYYASGQVEILTFYGDVYDKDTRNLKSNQIITVVDRAYIISQETNPSWLGGDDIFHAGWRDRPDNLYAQGPLANLVGMQYRLNHLENLKADVFDQIATPILKIKGEVEDFDNRPGARIYMGEDGDVAYLAPDATALQADFQIQALENKMEEMAGAPRQAMGIRTPGEKTAFEVQSLDTSAGRIFQHKAQKFEQEFLEPALNAMLASARRNLNRSDVVRSTDEETNVALFDTITRDDLRANGRLYPVGARHFAERSKRVQELNQLIQAKSIQGVGEHLSGKRLAQLLTQELGEETLFADNVQIYEAAEAAKVSQLEEGAVMDDIATAGELGI